MMNHKYAGKALMEGLIDGTLSGGQRPFIYIRNLVTTRTIKSLVDMFGLDLYHPG